MEWTHYFRLFKCLLEFLLQQLELAMQRMQVSSLRALLEVQMLRLQRKLAN